MTTPAIPDPRQQVIPAARNLFKALVLIALLFVSLYIINHIAIALETTALPAWAAFALKWTLVGLFAIANVVLLTGMGVLAHDAVHRVLFRSGVWNELWGGLLSALALIPFYSNRQFHLTHHSYAHQPGLDPEEAMHNRPFLAAATIGSVVGLGEQYRILFRNLLWQRAWRYTGRALKDLAFVGFAGTIYFVLLPVLGISLAFTVVPVLLVFPLVFAFRAMSDHYGIAPIERTVQQREDVLEADERTWRAERARRRREVSGWVVLTAPWLEWLWSNVNYHEVHHKYPYLSYHYLPQAFAATRSRYPYRVVRGYWRSLRNLRRQPYYGAPAPARLASSLKR